MIQLRWAPGPVCPQRYAATLRSLSTEWDYRETMRKIYREVYPPELVEGSVLYDIIGDSLISATFANGSD